jgi:hypothetical protein
MCQSGMTRDLTQETHDLHLISKPHHAGLPMDTMHAVHEVDLCHFIFFVRPTTIKLTPLGP